MPETMFEMLVRLAETTPPERMGEVAAELAKILPKEALDENLLEVLAQRARIGDYEAFYEGIHGAPMLSFNQEGYQIEQEGFADGDVFLYLGFRGCRKTTTFGITQAAFLHGMHPSETGVITGANDANALLIAKSIAALIEFHPFFARAFPHVKPDPNRGWGDKGYWVRQTHEIKDGQLVEISREEWTRGQAKVNDPSFVGGGYKSSNINGKHPSLYLLVDDLHDIDTMKSSTENEYIKLVFLTQILKTVIREGGRMKTRVIMTGVPFTRTDTYATMKESGGTTCYKLPVMVKAAHGEGTYIDGINPKTGVAYEDIVGWWHLTWPEEFGVKTIINIRSEGKAAFWQMMMLDIETAKGGRLKYITYPHENIDPQWQHGAGVDWAILSDDRPDPGRDMFGMAIGCKTPLNQLVVADVVLEQLTQAKAESLIVSRSGMYYNWRGTTIEGDGGGEGFAISIIQRNPGVVVQYLKTNTATYRNKMLRQERELGPWLENGTVLISDALTPGLIALRNALDDFPDGNKDVRDAVYWLCRQFPDCLVISVPLDELPSAARKQKRKSPYAGFIGGFR
jgi:hypothetical protein